MAIWSWPGELFDEPEVQELADLWFTALSALAEYAERPGAGGLTPPTCPSWTSRRTNSMNSKVI